MSPQDRARIDELYRKYRGLQYSIARSRLRDHERAEEALGRTWHRIMNYYNTNEIRCFREWSLKILQNVINILANESKKSPSISPDILEPPTREPSPELHLQNHERNLVVWFTIEKLPDDLKQIVLLRYYEGLSFQEIAFILGKSDSWACNKHQKALQALGRLLKGRTDGV